jgi:HEAT repeat protein
LLAFIEAKDRDSFAKVLAVWALRDSGAKDAAPKLKRILETTEDQESGFGGNIMDPRVGTHFPGSVHKAIAEVLASWDKSIEQGGGGQSATRPESK